MSTPSVITGVAALSGASTTFAALAAALFAEPAPPATRGAVRLSGFAPESVLGARGLSQFDGATRMALCAAHEALAMAEVSSTSPGDRSRLGVVVSSNLAVLGTVHRAAATIRSHGSGELRPIDLPNASPNVAASHVAIRHVLRAANLTVANGFASGMDAVLQAELLLRSERADLVLVIGVEELSTEAAALLGAARGNHEMLAEHGAMLGEGAAALVLEGAAHARARGVAPRAYLTGHAARQCLRDDDASAIAASMAECLARARIGRTDLGLIVSADGGVGDWHARESAGLERALGGAGNGAPIARIVPKARLGETYGAAGVFQLIAALTCLERGRAFAAPRDWLRSRDTCRAAPLVADATVPLAAARALVLGWGPREKCVAVTLEAA